MRLSPIYTLLMITALITFSCKSDDDVTVAPIPIETNAETYTFARDGQSSVDITEEIDLANMLDDIIAYTEEGNAGAIVEARVLRAILENRDENGEELFDFMSPAQLESLLFPTDIQDDYFGDIFEQMAIASKSENQAQIGVAGLLTNRSGNNFLVNNLGQGMSPFIEKGVMSSVFLYQMFNIMIGDEFVGDDVDNINLVEGTNTTLLEQNWDRAFGYFHAPGDFGSNWPPNRNDELRYWSHYAKVVDPSLGISESIMNAFRDGRLAITEGDLEIKNKSREIIINDLQLLAAAACVHYVNNSLIHYDAGENADMIYNLSSAYMFGRGLFMNPNRAILSTELHNLLNVDFGNGGVFWTVEREGLENAKAKLVEAYPSLVDVVDEL